MTQAQTQSLLVREALLHSIDLSSVSMECFAMSRVQA
jgi:hypothetical protein